MFSAAATRLEVVEAIADIILDLTDDGTEVDEIAEDAARDMATILLETMEFEVTGVDDEGVVTARLTIPLVVQ